MRLFFLPEKRDRLEDVVLSLLEACLYDVANAERQIRELVDLQFEYVEFDQSCQRDSSLVVPGFALVERRFPEEPLLRRGDGYPQPALRRDHREDLEAARDDQLQQYVERVIPQ